MYVCRVCVCARVGVHACGHAPALYACLGRCRRVDVCVSSSHLSRVMTPSVMLQVRAVARCVALITCADAAVVWLSAHAVRRQHQVLRGAGREVSRAAIHRCEGVYYATFPCVCMCARACVYCVCAHECAFGQGVGVECLAVDVDVSVWMLVHLCAGVCLCVHVCTLSRGGRCAWRGIDHVYEWWCLAGAARAGRDQQPPSAEDLQGQVAISVVNSE
jgi:hypothetical protein